MASQRIKSSENKRGKITDGQRKKVDEIIQEAEEATPPTPPEPPGVLEAKYRESESKRLMLAEALHASQSQLRNLTGMTGADEERALPFGYFVGYGRQDDDQKTAIIRHHGRL